MRLERTVVPVEYVNNSCVYCRAACGLWIDADIYHGRTQSCDTFDNEPLTGENEDFIVKAIEVWSLREDDFA